MKHHLIEPVASQQTRELAEQSSRPVCHREKRHKEDNDPTEIIIMEYSSNIYIQMHTYKNINRGSLCLVNHTHLYCRGSLVFIATPRGIR